MYQESLTLSMFAPGITKSADFESLPMITIWNIPTQMHSLTQLKFKVTKVLDCEPESRAHFCEPLTFVLTFCFNFTLTFYSLKLHLVTNKAKKKIDFLCLCNSSQVINFLREKITGNRQPIYYSKTYIPLNEIKLTDGKIYWAEFHVRQNSLPLLKSTSFK